MPANANETNVLALSYRCCLLQKEQQTQAEQLSTAVAEEREQRLQLEGTVAPLQQQVQALLTGATLAGGTNGASQLGPAAAVLTAEGAHNAASAAQ